VIGIPLKVAIAASLVNDITVSDAASAVYFKKRK
jgi:hypothetical protein